MVALYHLFDPLVRNYDKTGVSKDSFSKYFHKTKEKVSCSINDKEPKNRVVWRTSIPGFEDYKFVKANKSVYYEDDGDGSWVFDLF
jgi:hypothetical protein